MHPRKYFPLGRAVGKAFCNRANETQKLLENIEANKHTLLIAPRRFGKTSLAEKAIAKFKLPHVSVSFNTCSDEQDVAQLVSSAASQLIGQSFNQADKLLNLIKNSVKHLTPKISIGGKFIQLELVPESRKTPAQTIIAESLMLVEKLFTEKNNQRAVMLLDEFQTVGQIAKGKGVEAAIRNAAQDMAHLTIIFSGSNRSLLNTMFEDENRPLYKLCRKLYLSRIDVEHYHSHLNEAAKVAWNEPLPQAVFDKIMLLSERHPYYVNYLCDVVWTEQKNLPSVSDVDAAWKQVVQEEESDANAEIARFAPGQRKIIKYLANNLDDGSLMSSEAISQLGMAQSSIAGAVTALVEKDIIEKDANGYNIINPIIKCLFQLNVKS